MLNIELSQLISPIHPYGIIVIGAVCPKFILHIIGKSVNFNSSLNAF